MAFDSNAGTRPQLKYKILQDLGTVIKNNGYEIKVQLIKWGG